MMRTACHAVAVFVSVFIVLGAPAAHAQSCYDLWYERNAIYDSYGFCFKTSLAKRTFDNSDCYTRNPKLSRGDQSEVDRIRRQERSRGCKVNR